MSRITKNKKRINPRYHLHEGNALQDDVTAFYRKLPYPAHKQPGKLPSGEDFGLVGAGKYVEQYMAMNPDADEREVADIIEMLMDQERSRDLKAKNMNESKQPTIKNLMEGLKNYNKGEE